ncbi:hypothetical protein Misp02_30320 [Microtetraspora sp. NBRC 16547]|nr:hypothetical protein Misp02_30320 [Microtetraspora sp. NBRC 16547]
MDLCLGLRRWMEVVGSLASPGADVAIAEPGLIGRIIAAWPSLALIGSYELLMFPGPRVRRQRPKSRLISASTLLPMPMATPWNSMTIGKTPSYPLNTAGTAGCCSERPGGRSCKTVSQAEICQAASPSLGPRTT